MTYHRRLYCSRHQQQYTIKPDNSANIGIPNPRPNSSNRESSVDVIEVVEVAVFVDELLLVDVLVDVLLLLLLVDVLVVVSPGPRSYLRIKLVNKFALTYREDFDLYQPL